MNEIENPIESLKNTVPFSCRDYGVEKRDAWVYGIICGWTDECFEEFNAKFGWDKDTWDRLKRLHNRFEELEELAQAKQDGRLVVLPCKVGDTVKVRSDTWGNTWNFKTIDNGKFLKGKIIAIIKTKKQTLIKIQVEHNVSWKIEENGTHSVH